MHISRFQEKETLVRWKIFGEGGWIHTASFKLKIVSYPIVAIKMFLKGDWKDLAYKINTLKKAFGFNCMIYICLT